MRIRQIDSRNALYGLLKYQIRFNTKDKARYFSIMGWCHETWGWTIDYYNFNELTAEFNKNKWSWRCTDTRSSLAILELYLASDEELTLFNLRWIGNE